MGRNLAGAVVVITGASSGIGRESAHAFARKGASVVVAARREQPLHDLVAELERLGVGALAVPTDVTDPDAVERLARRAEERFGGIDVWINNAGVYLAGRFEDTPPEAFQRVMDVNVNGVVYGSRAALPRLRARRGVLINTASVDGAATFPYFTAYVASKWAVRGFTAALRQEYLDGSVDICAIMPAVIDTPLFQHAANYTGWEMKTMDPVYEPAMVAEAMVSCAEHPKREVIVGDAGRLLAFQWSAMPRLSERMFAGMARSQHFRHDRPVPPTDGNLFEPVAEGTDARGGWGGSRAPDLIGRAGALGLTVLAPTAALLATSRGRGWVGGLVDGISDGFNGRRRRRSGLARLTRPIRKALGVA